ncbi:type II toxin-antitoxin system Phd/YefM family antitoxin [Chloroflexi bacterium TSY]|nr:type II toxin-antitoxin system Phd/YefM family antitoxin [Chloroflexi bacterium TSY]
MNATPQIIPVSELRNNYNRVLDLAQIEPVFLTENGRAAGVLISTDAWDRLAEKLEDFQDVIAILEAELAVARGEDEVADINIEELKTMALSNELQAEAI